MLIRKLAIVVLLVVPALGWAQTTEPGRQAQLAYAHSAVQKAGLASIWATAALGAITAVNADVLGDEQCIACTGDMNRPAYDALVVSHFALALTSLGLWISSEVLAEQMNPNPYYTGDPHLQDTMRGLRWTNLGLFAAQPVLGLLAAHPGLIGVPPENRRAFSRVMRTIHLAVGAGTAASYSATAAIQW